MRIVIDMQGAQTVSRFRGIGRYTLNFAKSLVRNRGGHEIYLALNGLFTEPIDPIRSAFDGLLPQENIRVFSASGPVSEINFGNKSRRQVSEFLREAFLESLNPDIIHICSLFEGYLDDAVTSIGLLEMSTPVSVTFHDLIPLLNYEHYLEQNKTFSAFYHSKLAFLRRASILLTQSESVSREGVKHIPFNKNNIVNTSTGLSLTLKKLSSKSLLPQDIVQPFIFTSGS